MTTDAERSTEPLAPEFFAGPDATTSGVTIRAIFRCFNKERDGALSREQYLLRQRALGTLQNLPAGIFALFLLLLIERFVRETRYARFCQATEGVGCDEKRWAQHCKALGVTDPSNGMRIGYFGKLYTQKRFKKHFGKGRSELEKVKQFLAAPASPAPDSAAPKQRSGSDDGTGHDATAPRAPSRCSVLRVGAASRKRTVAFTATGLLGIQWRPAATLKPPDAVTEVLGELQAAAADAGRKCPDKSAIASRGDLHPNAARHGQLPPPPRGFAAFEPSPIFDGARPGYQFQVGSMGLGYYWYGGAAGQAAVEAAKRAQRSNRGGESESESSDEDEDETEYGCVIDGLKPGSYAETLAKGDPGAADALQAGMVLRRVNDWPTDGTFSLLLPVCTPCLVVTLHAALQGRTCMFH